jgi:hypothetical protein
VFIWIVRAEKEIQVSCFLSKDKIDMDVKSLNEIKGDEAIKKLHSLLTRSKEKTC